MRLSDALNIAVSVLAQNGIEDHVTEAIVLLCYLLNIDNSRFYAEPERELSPGEVGSLDVLIARRISGEPSAYITQSRQFYGIDLYIDSRVLVPRPETEILVNAVVRFTSNHPLPHNPRLIADIGTGSGAITIALAKHVADCRIFASDISPEALEVAAINIQRHSLGEIVTLRQGYLLEPLEICVDIIVANLPYISDSDYAKLQREIAEHEPELALKGGLTGIELIRELMAQSKTMLSTGGALFIEIGLGQEDDLLAHARSVFSGANLSLIPDYAGINRVISIVT